MTLIVELLDISVHAREQFHSRDPSIEDFLKNRANKEHKLSISDTYVVVNDSLRSKILGYFTLSLHSLTVREILPQLAKKYPYNSVGTVLLGRIGRDHNSTPPGFGRILLKEAIKQSCKRGSFFALELYAKNEKLIDYYKKFGFTQLISDKRHMIMPYGLLVQVVEK